jgi:hypothetical protein
MATLNPSGASTTTDGDPAVPDRQCGRCRGTFVGDATLNPQALQEWWACPACRKIMFG